MRALFGMGLAGALAVTTACDLNAFIPEDARTFDIPADSSVTVPGSFTVGASPLAPEEVLPVDMGSILSQQIAQEFSTQDIQKEAVASMKVTLMTVTVRDAEENGTQVRDLGFLESMEFFLGAGELEPVSVASTAAGAFDGDPAPTAYEFELSDAELVDVLNAGDSMEMTADIVPEGRPNFGTTLDFHVMTTVIVDAQGAVESQQ
jgi:hypothetical protein